MKTQFQKLVRSLSVLGLAFCMAGSRADAQNPPVLDPDLYVGLTINGAVGTVYSIEYVTDLAETKNPSAWRCLEFLQLPVSPHLWTDTSAPVAGRRFFRAAVFPAPKNMAFIPPGTFRMGSPADEADRRDWEGPQTEVTIRRGFWMGKYEVTQEEYLAVMGTNPSQFSGDLNRPVERVSWVDASNYCAKITRQERAAGRIPPDALYRLPTAAEWEYACRGWTSTRFSYGDDPDYGDLAQYGWYRDNSSTDTRPSGGYYQDLASGQYYTTHPVGQKLPNPRGLYDIHGNVWEWCQDWFLDRLPGGTAVDPHGPATGSLRVACGGSWFSGNWACRSAMRGFEGPGTPQNYIGFRVVLAPSQP